MSQDCGCKKRNTTDVYAMRRESITISCNNCNGPLIDENGNYFPIHIMPVTVSTYQYELWRKEGHDLHIEGQ